MDSKLVILSQNSTTHVQNEGKKEKENNDVADGHSVCTLYTSFWLVQNLILESLSFPRMTGQIFFTSLIYFRKRFRLSASPGSSIS